MAIVANLHRPFIVLEEDGQQCAGDESTSQISASSTSLSSISPCSVTSTASSGCADAPRKPPRQFHYTDIRQMAAPVASTSSGAGPLRQPIRIAQPPPQVCSAQQHYAAFNRLNQNCTPMTTTFPANVADATTTFAHYNSVPSLQKNNVVHKPSVSSASFSTLIHHPMQQQQRRRDSVDSTTNQTHKIRYNSLMETAVAQQRQIDANSCELEERRQLISSTIGAGTSSSSIMKDKRATHVGQQVVGLKNRIAHDEREMAKLGAVQREARQLAHHNQLQKRELAELENAYTQDDVQLRKAVDKVDVLRKQLDLLYQRRASAASAAIAQQRIVNGDLASNTKESTSSSLLSDLQVNGKSITNSQAPGIKSLTQQLQQQRPQASVGPFQFSTLQNENNSGVEDEVKKCSLPSYDQIDAAVNGSKIVTITHSQPSRQQHKKTVRAPPPPFKASANGYGQSTFGKEMGNYSNNHYSMDETPDQRLARGKPDQLSLRADSLTAMKRRSWAQAESAASNGSCAESENIWRYLVEEQKKGRTHISFADIIAARKPNTTASASASIKSMAGAAGATDSVEKLHYHHSNIETACASLPPAPSQQQQKPKPKSVVDEPEDELDMPTTSDCSAVALPAPSKTNVFYSVSSVQTQNSTISQDDPSAEECQSSAEEKGKNDGQKQDSEKNKESEVENTAEEANKQCITMQDSMQKELEERLGDEERIEEEEDMDEPSEFVTIDSVELGHHEEASSTTTDEASTISGDEPAFEELSSRTADNYKSILRTPGKQHHNRRVVFDQVVLFLDVAYEGEYDMLVQLAKSIPDISVANGEGITALHNAICAGNHDIVKFLIDNNADVNALDSDGWSPLHCAASCNNLVMLKQLIENGACVFATTISKTETAANLFDETHEYEAGAEYIELVEKCMGVVNDGKVYAAFSYEAQNEDELNFQEGDELRVIQRNDEEGDYQSKPADVYWWLCEHTKDGSNKGLVPRNYLSLFPIWRHRHRHNFQNFELPLAGVPHTTSTGKWNQSESDVMVNSSPTSNSSTTTSRELSTYA